MSLFADGAVKRFTKINFIPIIEMALKKIKLPNNQILNLARELKIRFPDSRLKIFKEKRKIIIKSRTQINFFEMKEIELIVKQYYPNHQIHFQ